jgi:hypothetical protein
VDLPPRPARSLRDVFALALLVGKLDGPPMGPDEWAGLVRQSEDEADRLTAPPAPLEPRP